MAPFFLSAAMALFAVQDAAPAPSAGPRYGLESGQAQIQFEIPTNIGPVKGTVDIVRLEVKGPQGWSRFSFRLEVDPTSVKTGDAFRDRFIAEKVLKASAGSLVVQGSERVAPRRKSPAEPLSDPRVRAWMDPARKRAFVEFPYTWADDEDMRGGQFTFRHSAELEKLGLPRPPHPFIKVTGPLKIQFSGHLPRT
jgi:hypothetical protein